MARRKFGQHFLKDKVWKKRILEEFKPPNGFAEIGPGKGAITRLLAEKHSEFTVFEVDPELEGFHQDQKSYEFILKDFLDWDFRLDDRRVNNFSLISNLPYESATAIFLRVLERADQITHFVFMFQREVAERIAAEAGSRRFGALSVLAQGQYELKYRGPISPKAFSPPPKVDSAVVIGHRKTHPVVYSKAYREFVWFAFHQKRKKLRNVLKNKYEEGDIDHFLSRNDLSLGIRAESLAVDYWPKLFEALSRNESNS